MSIRHSKTRLLSLSNNRSVRYACLRMAGTATTTSNELVTLAFLARSGGDCADEEASRVENGMHYAQHVRQHASPPHPTVRRATAGGLRLAVSGCDYCDFHHARTSDNRRSRIWLRCLTLWVSPIHRRFSHKATSFDQLCRADWRFEYSWI